MTSLVRQLAALVRLSFLELWRRNDVFVMVILSVALLVPFAMATPFGVTGASRYVDEMALLLVWCFSLFVSLGAGARLFPPEFESRTIYPLLAKPISRGRLLVGKYLGAVAASGSALLCFYALFAASRALRGGSLISGALAEGVVLHLAFVALAVALSLLGSLLVSPAASHAFNGLVLVAMFLYGRRLPELADGVSPVAAWVARVAYAVGPHAEFFDMRQRIVHGWGGVDGVVLLAALGYAAAYVAVVLALATAVLKRRKL